MNCPSISLVKSTLAEFPSFSRAFLNNASGGRGQKRIIPMKFRIAGLVLNLIALFSNEWAAKKLCQLWFTVFKNHPRPWVNKFWNQADRRIEINLSDQSIPVYCWGNGPLVVLMHGWSGSGTQFKYIIPALTKAGYQVAVFDAPAHGNNEGKQADLLDFSDSLVAIQQQIGPVDTVIAHSFGAMAVTLATHRGLTLNRIVLVAPNLDVQVIFDSYSLLLKLKGKLAHRFKTLVGIKMAKILQIENPWEVLKADFLLDDKDQPGLLIFNDIDEEVPESHFKEIERLWKNAKIIKTQGLGHVRLLKDPEVINNITHFLNTTR